MKQYMLSAYLERLDNMIEEGARTPLDQQFLNFDLKMFIQEVWNDGYFQGLSQSESFEFRHNNPNSDD